MILALAAAAALAAVPTDAVHVRLGETVTLTVGAAGAEIAAVSTDTDQRLAAASQPLCHGAPAATPDAPAPLPADEIEVTFGKEQCSTATTIVIVRNGYERAVSFSGAVCAGQPQGRCRIEPRGGTFGEWRVYPEIELRAFSLERP